MAAPAPPSTTPLSGTEATIWDNEWPLLTAAYSATQQGEYIRAIFEHAKPFVRSAAEYAKSLFGNAVFGGIDAQGGFGWQILRPEHLLRTSTGGVNSAISTAPDGMDWTASFPSAHSFQFFVGTASAFSVINRRAVVVLIGLASFAPSPKVIEAQVLIGGVTFPIYSVYWPFQITSPNPNIYAAWGFPTPKTIPRLQQVKVLLNPKVAGADEIAVLGVTYGEASYIQAQTPTLESP